MKKFLLMLLALILIGNSQSIVHAAGFANANNGAYSVNASLSCYVNAMGGVEFGGPLLRGAEVTVNSGKAIMKLTFGKSAVTIYGITCDTFIDASPSGSANGQGVQAGTIGYYDKNGNLNTSNVTTTLSTDTALNPANEAVQYVTSMSFPIDQVSSTYQLTLYVNSNVMGSQFGAGGSPATLTVDWSNVPGVEVENNSSSGNHSSSENTGTSGSANTNGGTSSGQTSSNGNSGVAGSAGTSENTSASGSTGTAGSTNVGDNSDLTGSANTSEDSVGGDSSTGDTTSTQDVETDESKNVASVEKDGLNIYYANGENSTKPEEDTEKTSDGMAEKVALGVVAVCVTVALGVGSVILKKKLKRKNKV